MNVHTLIISARRSRAYSYRPPHPAKLAMWQKSFEDLCKDKPETTRDTIKTSILTALGDAYIRNKSATTLHNITNMILPMQENSGSNRLLILPVPSHAVNQRHLYRDFTSQWHAWQSNVPEHAVVRFLGSRTRAHRDYMHPDTRMFHTNVWRNSYTRCSCVHYAMMEKVMLASSTRMLFVHNSDSIGTLRMITQIPLYSLYREAFKDGDGSMAKAYLSQFYELDFATNYYGPARLEYAAARLSQLMAIRNESPVLAPAPGDGPNDPVPPIISEPGVMPMPRSPVGSAEILRSFVQQLNTMPPPGDPRWQAEQPRTRRVTTP